MLNRYRSLDNNYFCGGSGLHIGDPETGPAPANPQPGVHFLKSCQPSTPPTDPRPAAVCVGYIARDPGAAAVLSPTFFGSVDSSCLAKHLALPFTCPFLCTCPCNQLCRNGTSSDFGPANAGSTSSFPPSSLITRFCGVEVALRLPHLPSLNFPLSQADSFSAAAALQP